MGKSYAFFKQILEHCKWIFSGIGIFILHLLLYSENSEEYYQQFFWSGVGVIVLISISVFCYKKISFKKQGNRKGIRKDCETTEINMHLEDILIDSLEKHRNNVDKK
jgi:hypothetical protein